ncbi:hypothetical protein T484DRAFT_1779729, partial [Baffinella frigidus]
VPGCLFSIGKPLPPSAAALQHPFPCFPPLDAVDVQDPNWWQLRLELFKQITDKTAEQKAEIKRLIDRQITGKTTEQKAEVKRLINRQKITDKSTEQKAEIKRLIDRQKITDKSTEQKAEIKRLIDRQLAEAQQHLDYLSGLVLERCAETLAAHLAELQQHLDYLNAVEIACGDRPK